LAVFGRIPSLRILSLSGNSFSDPGLKHLAGLKELQALHLGQNRLPITDAGAINLAGLMALESLDLQGAHLTDTAVAALKNLKQLRRLYLNSASGKSGITDASIEHLLGMTKLTRLWIQNTALTDKGVQQLFDLMDLKELYLSTSAISEKLRTELQQLRPSSLKLHLLVQPTPK